MPKINSPDFVEGDVVQKTDITDLKDSIDGSLIGKIDGENIREEGLDRRVFAADSIVPKYEKTQKVYSSSRLNVVANEHWRYVNYSNPATLKGNKLVGNRPSLGIDWDPETDTHCVIRLSMFVDTKHMPTRPQTGNFYWDFGLVVCPPDVDSPSTLRTGHTRTGSPLPSVSPFQRVGLQNAFTAHLKTGYWTKGQTSSLVPGYSETSDSAERFNPDGDAPNIFGYQNDTYPRGAWYQYAYDRGANLNASITLTCHASSQLNNAPKGVFFWPTAGQAKVFVCYRSSIAVPKPAGITVENLNLSYQVYRR